MESEDILFFNDTIIKWGMVEIIDRFNLKSTKPTSGMLGYYFTKKNPNRYFKKHLGFTQIGWQEGKNIVKITDHKKFMLFRIKYGL